MLADSDIMQGGRFGKKYIADADSVICGPMVANDKGDRLAFAWKDGAILKLYREA